MSESILFLCGQIEPLEQCVLEELLDYYQRGAEIHGIFSNKSQILSLVAAIDAILAEKNLARDGMGLVPSSFQEDAVMEGKSFFLFHGSFHLWDIPYPLETKIIHADEIATVLPILEKYQSTFDVSQFCAITDPEAHNILVEGVGGTGKTWVLLTRFLFLWKKTALCDASFLESSKIVLFQLAQKNACVTFLQKELECSFLLTGQDKYSRMHSAVHKIQFYTVHTLIEEALLRSGERLRVVEELDLLKKIILQTTQLFIQENSEKLREMQNLNLTFGQIESHLLKLVLNIFKENLDLRQLTRSSFGAVKKNDPYGNMKVLYHESVLEIARLWKDTLVSQGKIHKNQVISHFIEKELSLEDEKSLLIDDLHLMNDGEIEAIFTYVKNKQTFLFVCQNRAETKFVQERNRFFQRFFSGNQVNLWHFFSLKHQYRMDKELFNIYQTIFLATNQMILWNNYNGYLEGYQDKYYHLTKYYGETDKNVAIYDEIMRIKRRLGYENQQGINKQGLLNTFAIVVDTQEEVVDIVDKFKEYDIYIHSFHVKSRVLTDMKILLKALLYYDDAGALHQLLESNFFDVSIPTAELYLQRDRCRGEKNGVLEFLRSIISEKFSEMTEEQYDWEDFQDKLFSNIGYLWKFYQITVPWIKIAKSEQENYRRNYMYLWSTIEKAGILTLTELYDYILKTKFEFISQKTPEYEGLLLHCLTLNESVGFEFGHILYLCSEVKENEILLLQSSPPIFAYEFILHWENQSFSSEFYVEMNKKSEIKRMNDLYFLLSKCQYSFSWLTIERDKKTNEEALLERGLQDYGL